MLTVTYAECHISASNAQCCYAECRYAECRYAECNGADTTHIETILFYRIAQGKVAVAAF